MTIVAKVTAPPKRTRLMAAIHNRLDQLRSLREKFDGWENPVTGTGTSRDRTTHASFNPNALLSDIVLSHLYHNDDMAARMVDTIPEEMLREPFKVDVDDSVVNSQIAEKFEDLDVRGKFTEGLIWGRLFGGAATIIGADDLQVAEAPLVEERAKGISFLYTVDRRLLHPETYYEELGHPKLGHPETYRLTFEGQRNAQLRIHESRLILWPGARTADRERIANNYWDYSILQRAYEVLRQFNSAWQSVDVLLSEANQNVFKLANLGEEVGAKGEEVVSARMQLIDMYRSLTRALVLDAGNPDQGEPAEDFERFPASFTDIPDILDKVMLRLASTVQMPVTILMGQSPAGMNATGESDFRWFYDKIGTAQQNILTPRIRRLVKVLLASEEGRNHQAENTAVTFEPLWTETPAQEAERRSSIAQADATYIEHGVLVPEEVAISRFRPEGFNNEIDLDEDAIAFRTKVLELRRKDPKMLVADPNVPPGQSSPPSGGKPGDSDPDKSDTDEEDEDEDEDEDNPIRQDSDPDAIVDYVDMVEQLRDHPRVIVAGAARCGKTSTATRASERFGRRVFYEDVMFQNEAVAREEQERIVAEHIASDGEWVLEGCAAVLGIRKWLRDNPDQKFPATVLWLRSPLHRQTEAHRIQAKGIRTIWQQVLPELRKRGATVIERDQ